MVGPFYNVVAPQPHHNKYLTVYVLSVLVLKDIWVLRGVIYFSVASIFLTRLYDVEYPFHILSEAGGLSLKYISVMG